MVNIKHEYFIAELTFSRQGHSSVWGELVPASYMSPFLLSKDLQLWKSSVLHCIGPQVEQGLESGLSGYQLVLDK